LHDVEEISVTQDKKVIRLNFGRITKQTVESMASDTLGNVVVLPVPSATPAVQPPRKPIAFIKLDDERLQIKEAGVYTTFNFASRQVFYQSEDGINHETRAFDGVASRDLEEAHATLKQLGGKPPAL
jgi:hypothetical protein